MSEFLMIFFVYAFLGWCMEVSYAALTSGKFVNRGFLNGPVCPIYGFGAVICLACLEPLKDSLILLFIGSVVLTSLLELVTGYLLEKLFHQRWWDYSDMPFNLGGYICPLFSVLWGLACLFVVKLIHPTILFLIRLIPDRVLPILLVLFSAVMLVDVAATINAITGINRRLRQIDELAGKIRTVSDEFGENLADRVLGAAERGSELKDELADWHAEAAQRREAHRADSEAERESWKEELDELKDELSQKATAAAEEHTRYMAEKRAELERFHASMVELLDVKGFGQRRLLRAFPKMRSNDHGTALEHLRRHLNRSGSDHSGKAS